jgi:hypothetical protein
VARSPTFTTGTGAATLRPRSPLWWTHSAGAVTIGRAAGFDVTEASIDYADELDLEHLVGSLYSALSIQQLPPPDQRPAFAEQVRRAVAPHERFTEHVRVRMLLGRAR